MPRRGNRIVSPSDIYPCAPGGPNDYVMMHVVTSHMYDALAIALDRPDLLTDARFATQEARTKHGDELFETVAAWTRQRTKFEVMDALAGAGVPYSAVMDSGDLFRNEHLRARDMIATMHHPVRGGWEFPRAPVRFSRSRTKLAPSPLVGQHTDEVLREELALAEDDLQRLRSAGII